ncbi:MAG TPA: hypothetical protein VIF40_07215 [Methylosinus sp.]
MVDQTIHNRTPSEIFGSESLDRRSAMDATEFRMARKSVSAVNAINGERRVDERSAVQKSHAFVQISIPVEAKIHERTFAEKQCQSVASETIARGRRIDPVVRAERVHEVHAGFDIVERRMFERPKITCGNVDATQVLLAQSAP